MRFLQALAVTLEDEELTSFLEALETPVAQEDRLMWKWRLCRRTLEPMPSSSQMWTSSSESGDESAD